MIESDIFELHVMIFRNKTENKNQSKTKKVNPELMQNKKTGTFIPERNSIC